VPDSTPDLAPESISPEIFNHLVDLAALELSAQEGEYIRRQLNGQLKAVRELEAIDIGDIPITSHGVPYAPAISPPPRPDEIRPFSEPDAILAQAPEVDGRYIVVPDIPHEDLE
jgi:aspartyl-tRNA(Asn)/glutamyl-tRNA(Gln) amidotransferase subunit C